MEFYFTSAKNLHEHVLLTYPINHLTMYHCSPPKPKSVVRYDTLQASHQGVTGRNMADEEGLFSENEKGGESDEDEIVTSPEVVSVLAPTSTPAPRMNATAAASTGGSSTTTTAPAPTRKIVVSQQPLPAAGGAGTKPSTTPDAGADAKAKAENAGGRPFKVENVFSTVVKELGENSSLDVREKVQQLLKKDKVLLQDMAPLLRHATEYVYGDVVFENQTIADLIAKTIKKEEEKVVLLKHAVPIEGILIRNGALDWEVSCFMLFSKTFQTTPFFTHF